MTKKTTILHTSLPFEKLVFLEHNPRTRTPEGLRAMADDIQADHDVLGWKEVPCIIEKDLPPDTMVAAHQLRRRCYGLEIDPKYCQVIIDRMHKLDPALPIAINGKPYKPEN